MGKKYLITGGLGFIGKAITLSLLSKNNTVIIADNNFRKKKNDLKHKNLYVNKFINFMIIFNIINLINFHLFI